jgi:hypothetical protein
LRSLSRRVTAVLSYHVPWPMMFSAMKNPVHTIKTCVELKIVV